MNKRQLCGRYSSPSPNKKQWVWSMALLYTMQYTYFLFWSNQILLNWRLAVQWSFHQLWVFSDFSMREPVLCIIICVSTLWTNTQEGQTRRSQIVYTGENIPMRGTFEEDRKNTRTPWSSGYGRSLMYWKLWVRLPATYTGGKNWFVVKNVMFVSKRPENKQKYAHFLKRNIKAIEIDPPVGNVKNKFGHCATEIKLSNW